MMLSILFVRFEARHAKERGEIADAFNSLCEILQKRPTAENETKTTFNSLCEIPKPEEIAKAQAEKLSILFVRFERKGESR